MSRVARKRDVLGAVVALLGGLLLLRLVACGPITGASWIDAGAGTSEAGAGTGEVKVAADDVIVGAGPAASTAPIVIDGDAARPISPGARASLDLELTNTHDYAMKVSDLSVTVRSVSAPNADRGHPCAVGDFTVNQVPSSVVLTLAAGATSTLSSLGLSRDKLPHLSILDRPVDQDGCKGSTLTLQYDASWTPEKR